MSKRRNLIKALSIAGAAGAVDQWKKPIVSGVLLPAHAATSCAYCFTVSVTGNSGGGGAGMDIIDHDGCSTVDGNGDGGDAPFTEQFCFDLPPGTYTLDGSGGSGGGATVTVTARCCGDSETLAQGTDTDFDITAELIIEDDGHCSIMNTNSSPCF